jgi:hypothetical protein
MRTGVFQIIHANEVSASMHLERFPIFVHPADKEEATDEALTASRHRRHASGGPILLAECVFSEAERKENTSMNGE